MPAYLTQAADRAATQAVDDRIKNAHRETHRRAQELERQAEKRHAAYTSFMGVLRELVPGWRPFPGRFEWGEENGHIVATVVLEGRLRFGFVHHQQESVGHRVSGVVGPAASDQAEQLYSYGKLKGREWLDEQIVRWGLA